MLNLFYDEPDTDRWLPFDRYPRRVIRRLVRGKHNPGGHKRLFLNLIAGLDRIGVRYRVNDYSFAKKNPKTMACIIGKSFLLEKIKWENPILFGAAGYSHPVDDINLLERLPIKKILVPGRWMKEMCEHYWGTSVEVWPVGIDTHLWQPSGHEKKNIDVLLYDKVRWEHDHYELSLIEPIREVLKRCGLSFKELRYGYYREEDFQTALSQCRTMIFLCEHETQGIAYQQALACGVPILAWDRGGFWQDPSYYPDRVKFGPVSSVPYWDDRCGVRFQDSHEFPHKLEEFLLKLHDDQFSPRDYIMENLTLEICAQRYVEIVQSVTGNLG